MCNLDVADPVERWRRAAEALGEPLASGYRWCACRDCFEIVIGTDSAYCDDCLEAGCPDYQGVDGMPQECQASGAYGCGE